MIVNITELHVDDGEPAKVMAYRGLFRCTDAAVCLHSRLCYLRAYAADLRFAGGDRLLSRARVRRQTQARSMNDCIRLIAPDEHVHHAVLEDLEAADGAPELLADFRVFNGHREQAVDRAGRFRTQSDYRLVDDPLELGASTVGWAYQRLGIHGDVLQSYLRGEAAVDGARRLCRQALCLRTDDERAERPWCSASASQTRYHDDPIRPRRPDDQRLPASDAITRTVSDGSSANVSQNPAVALLPACKRKDLLPANDRRQMVLSLCGGARTRNERRRTHDRGDVRPNYEACTKCPHHEHRLERRPTQASGLLGQRCTQDAQIGQLGPEPTIPACLGGGRSPANLESILLAHEPLDCRSQQSVIVSQPKIQAATFQGRSEIALMIHRTHGL
jgi:hypothetical protein